jgi:hypothetical protein
MIYYVHAIGQLAAVVRPAGFGPPVFSTPSGNFGNLTAGLMAKRSGVNIGRFVAATNANDVVPEYLSTGRFEPRPSIHTVNAMDVANPSNFDLDHHAAAATSTRSAATSRAAGTTTTSARDVQNGYGKRGTCSIPRDGIGWSAVSWQSRQRQEGREGPGFFLRPRIRRSYRGHQAGHRAHSKKPAAGGGAWRRAADPGIERHVHAVRTPAITSIASDVRRAVSTIQPAVRTPPSLAGFVRDLYCYELRVLRDRLLRQEFPKKEYAGRVIELRDHYRVLSLRAREWLA